MSVFSELLKQDERSSESVDKQVTKKLSPGPDTGNSRDPGIPSPVWPHVHITNSGEHVSRAGDHVTRIHLNNDSPGPDQQDRVPVILRPGVHFNTSAGLSFFIYQFGFSVKNLVKDLY